VSNIRCFEVVTIPRGRRQIHGEKKKEVERSANSMPMYSLAHPFRLAARLQRWAIWPKVGRRKPAKIGEHCFPISLLRSNGGFGRWAADEAQERGGEARQK
jgi:hypothetical protein